MYVCICISLYICTAYILMSSACPNMSYVTCMSYVLVLCDVCSSDMIWNSGDEFRVLIV